MRAERQLGTVVMKRRSKDRKKEKASKEISAASISRQLEKKICLLKKTKYIHRLQKGIGGR